MRRGAGIGAIKNKNLAQVCNSRILDFRFNAYLIIYGPDAADNVTGTGTVTADQ